MDHVELVLLFLLVAVAALTWLALALDVPYPILLVIGGSVIGFAPGVPSIELNPDLVLLLVLPPLLFHAAYFASLRDLRANARAISLNASALVLLTMSAVAVAMHAVVPSCPGPRPSRSAPSSRRPTHWPRSPSRADSGCHVG
jgi:NhaP-type Na+/H+ or K+/H+ antiporter